MSKEEILLNGEKYISLRRARERTSYAKDYIGQLCRGGKVDCRMVGREWFVSESSLLDYKNKNNGEDKTIDIVEPQNVEILAAAEIPKIKQLGPSDSESENWRGVKIFVASSLVGLAAIVFLGMDVSSKPISNPVFLETVKSEVFESDANLALSLSGFESGIKNGWLSFWNGVNNFIADLFNDGGETTILVKTENKTENKNNNESIVVVKNYDETKPVFAGEQTAVVKERVVEKLNPNLIASLVDQRLNEINNNFLAQLEKFKNETAINFSAGSRVVSLLSKIDNLGSVSISSPTIYTPSISTPSISSPTISGNAGLETLTTSGNATIGGSLTVNGLQNFTGTSTFSGQGSFISLGIGTTSPFALLTVGSSTPTYLTSDQRYNSAYISGQLEVGGTATSTFAGYIDVKGPATATSTFTGNLHVLGTLRAATSYVGDLVFANAFRFTEDPMPTEGELATGTQSLKLKNQRGEDILTIDDQGNLVVNGAISSRTSAFGMTTISQIITDGFSLILDQFKQIGVTIADGVMSLKKLIVSDEVCIGETCINEAQLKEMINTNANMANINVNNANTETPPTTEPVVQPVVEPVSTTTPDMATTTSPL